MNNLGFIGLLNEVSEGLNWVGLKQKTAPCSDVLQPDEDSSWASISAAKETGLLTVCMRAMSVLCIVEWCFEVMFQCILQ